MKQRVYIVLLVLLSLFILYLLFLNGFRLIPKSLGRKLGFDSDADAVDITSSEENVIDNVGIDSDERWFEVTTRRKLKPLHTTKRPFIYTTTQEPPILRTEKTPTTKQPYETSTIRYSTETSTRPSSVDYNTISTHRHHHTHKPHHARNHTGHRHHHHHILHPTTPQIPLQSTQSTTTKVPFIEKDFTIVTALIDIGRGSWQEYRRPLQKYHEFMENLLSMRNKMVIFVDESSLDFVKKYREKMGLMHMTIIHSASFSDLPLYKYLEDAKSIIAAEKNNPFLYGKRWDAQMKNHPEANKAEYDILVNSKTYFLYNVTLENPFDTENFVWLDAGYGHGNQSVYPYDNVWRAAFPEKKIALIKLTPQFDPLSRYDINSLYRKDWSVLSGGFIAGDKHAIGQLYSLVHRRFIQLIYQSKVDDDQTVMVLVYKSYPQLFHIEHGDWFDAFRLFSVDRELQFG